MHFYICFTEEGIRFLHSQKVIHRDLKPENILIKKLENNQVSEPELRSYSLHSSLGLTQFFNVAQLSCYPPVFLCATLKNWLGPEDKANYSTKSIYFFFSWFYSAWLFSSTSKFMGSGGGFKRPQQYCSFDWYVWAAACWSCSFFLLVWQCSRWGKQREYEVYYYMWVCG